jgi:hypothetical protein
MLLAYPFLMSIIHRASLLDSNVLSNSPAASSFTSINGSNPAAQSSPPTTPRRAKTKSGSIMALDGSLMPTLPPNSVTFSAFLQVISLFQSYDSEEVKIKCTLCGESIRLILQLNAIFPSDFFCFFQQSCMSVCKRATILRYLYPLRECLGCFSSSPSKIRAFKRPLHCSSSRRSHASSRKVQW